MNWTSWPRQPSMATWCGKTWCGNTARQYPVPTYVVEFLLGRYCATTDENEIREGLEIVEQQLSNRTVRTGRGRVVQVEGARDTAR